MLSLFIVNNLYMKNIYCYFDFDSLFAYFLRYTLLATKFSQVQIISN